MSTPRHLEARPVAGRGRHARSVPGLAGRTRIDRQAHRTGIHRAEGGLLRSLYDQHAEPLLMIALSMTDGDRRLAEDVVRETLLTAWRDVDQIDVAASSLRPWLISIARRIVDDIRGGPYDDYGERRPETRRPEPKRFGTERAEPERFGTEHPEPQRLGIERPEPQRLGTQRFRTQRTGPQRLGTERTGAARHHDDEPPDDFGPALQRMMVLDGLRSLPQPDREILVEAYFRGRGVRDVADDLGLPPETVKWRLFFALRALQKVLMGSGTDDA